MTVKCFSYTSRFLSSNTWFANRSQKRLYAYTLSGLTLCSRRIYRMSNFTWPIFGLSNKTGSCMYLKLKVIKELMLTQFGLTVIRLNFRKCTQFNCILLVIVTYFCTIFGPLCICFRMCGKLAETCVSNARAKFHGFTIQWLSIPLVMCKWNTS